MIISGVTSVGKTYFLKQLLAAGEKCFTEKFSEIIWCTSILREQETRELKALFKNIKIIEGFPAEKIEKGTLIPRNKNACLVLGEFNWYLF
jgi:predicted AAA+ superfamily ATPase